MHAHPRTLADWLTHCEQLHPRGMDLGLSRVASVWRRLGVRLPGVTVVVAGTNGKGSSCALLEHIALAAGQRVGVYSKPHLLRFEERCRLGGQEVGPQDLLPDFEAVETARGDTTLSYFEFTTLVILRHLGRQPLDLVVLEVGLGGAQDAVNVVDADAVLITGVDIDHVDVLGPDREAIGLEKAGVMRPGRPAVVADPHPPASVLRHAQALGADLRCLSRQFIAGGVPGTGLWWWQGERFLLKDLPPPALSGDFQFRNAAGVLAVLEALAERLPVPAEAVRTGLRSARVLGRLQTLSHRPRVLVDVAHNRQSVAALFQHLAHPKPGAQPASAATGAAHPGRVLAVMGCMRDKAVDELLARAGPQVAAWHFCDLPTPRALPAQALADRWQALMAGTASTAKTAKTAPQATQHANPTVHCHPSPRAALQAALAHATPDDTVLVFGSFFTVAGALQATDLLADATPNACLTPTPEPTP